MQLPNSIVLVPRTAQVDVEGVVVVEGDGGGVNAVVGVDVEVVVCPAHSHGSPLLRHREDWGWHLFWCVSLQPNYLSEIQLDVQLSIEDLN